jgi:hypothetical protein
VPDEDWYLCTARLDGAERTFFWESSGVTPDRVILDDDGFVRSFASEEAARAIGAAEGWRIAPQSPSFYDLDAVATWCQSDADATDCSPLLNAWNLFGDLPPSDVYNEADRGATAIYDKLFHGCNLPSMTPDGQHYVPRWTAFETSTLKRVLLLGLADLRSRLR